MKMPLTLQAKIFAIFFTATILIVLSIFFFARSLDSSRKNNFQSVRKNLYVHLLSQIEKIGFPPHVPVAEAVAKELDLKIGISGPGIDWTSDASVESMELLKSKLNFHVKEFSFGLYKKHLFAVAEKNGYAYSFEFQSSEIFSFPYRLVLGFAAIVIIILAVSFIVTRWVMKPVGPLVKGVAELSKGNFGYRLQYQENDEFGFFAKIFNNMAQQIQQMLKAKDKLLLDVSHELRSPLGRMNVASEMIKEESLKSSLKEDLREMEFMVDELLERYRLNTPQGALKFKRINLAELLKELTGLYSTSGVGVLFQNTLSEEVWVRGEPVRLKKAVTNLLENGIKFSRDSSSPVELVLSSDSRYYVIQVTDHGIGIKESELNLIFEPFYKIDSSREKRNGGYGLGLSICKDIIKAHSGEISVASLENSHTQFTFFLPKIE